MAMSDTQSETINEEALAPFLASAKDASSDDIRKVIAVNRELMNRNERPFWQGQKINTATMQEIHHRLSVVLQERGAACFYCAFGQWAKGSQCEHD